jgi:hypothetical protein
MTPPVPLRVNFQIKFAHGRTISDDVWQLASPKSLFFLRQKPEKHNDVVPVTMLGFDTENNNARLIICKPLTR